MNDKRFNPVIENRLRSLVAIGNWASLISYLDGLSNAQFRTACFILAEQVMPQLTDESFWQLARLLVDYQPKAFLVTVLKSISGNRQVITPFSLDFFTSIKEREEDVRKTLNHLLPQLSNPDNALSLMTALACNDPHRRIAFFISNTTVVTAFLLMKVLHEVEDEHALLVRTAYFLMKKGDGLSFNIASLICACFGLEEVKGTFSLHIRPYEISRLMNDFEAFRRTLQQ